MNVKYLGDALDHWKGSLLESLQKANVLNDLKVDPMVTDAPWTQDEMNLYARLLRVERHQFITPDVDLDNWRRREEYFKKAKEHGGDLFVDPDTGVLTGKKPSGSRSKYIQASEIERLLARENRVMAVYQHAAQGKQMAQRVDDVRDFLKNREGMKTFAWCSYESATAAILFFSRNERIREISGCLRNLFSVRNTTAYKRIRSSFD